MFLDNEDQEKDVLFQTLQVLSEKRRRRHLSLITMSVSTFQSSKEYACYTCTHNVYMCVCVCVYVRVCGGGEVYQNYVLDRS